MIFGKKNHKGGVDLLLIVELATEHCQVSL